MPKYYIDINGRFKEVLSAWGDCQKYMKELGGLNFKSYPSYEEAKKSLDLILSGDAPDMYASRKEKSDAVSTKKKKSDDSKILSVDAKKVIIGCDEVGKVEPFKQLMSIAVFADPNISRESLGAGDSKTHTKEKDVEIGKLVTGFQSIADVDSKAHYNSEYGVVFCIKILSNEKYNYYKENKINVNSVLSYLHNEALLSVYDEAKKLGFDVDAFVIDDFINQVDSCKRFVAYVDKVIPSMRKISDIDDVSFSMVSKAESKYPDTVGLASNIGNFIDMLWQDYCIQKFKEKDIVFNREWFSNFSVPANDPNGINHVFDYIADKCGSVDDSPIVCKHTNYYTEYINIRRS